MTTPVLFKIGRTKREAEYGVTAVFPTLPGSPGNMTCYAHVGQHASCSLEWVWEQRNATPDEYAALLAELVRIGYDDLKICKRVTGAMRRPELKGFDQ